MADNQRNNPSEPTSEQHAREPRETLGTTGFPNAAEVEDDSPAADQHQATVPDLLARRVASDPRSYWRIVWDDFKSNSAAHIALWLMVAMALMGIFAPLLANHRPYVLLLEASAMQSVDAEVLSQGWQFPIFSSLRASDWILLFGFFEFVAAFGLFRLAKQRNNRVGPLGTTVLLVLGFLPVLCAAIFSPALSRWFDGEAAATASGFLGWSLTHWIIVGIVALTGAIVLLRATTNLYRNKRDEFGNLTTGPSITLAYCGSMLVLAAVSGIGTLGQRQLDVTDFHQLAQREDVSAIFPPVQHDFLQSESYISSQPPLGPYLRVQPSGGSKAAADLGLSDSRLGEDITLDPEPDDTSDSADEASAPGLTEQTPLSTLRGGLGVRTHDNPMKDFTIVTQSFDRISVSLYDAETVGDVIEAINKAADGKITASIVDGGSRIQLNDHTTPRPTYWMGTDASGADVASRLIHATRVALSIGFVSTGIALLIGITMGSLMGYFGGWVDMVGMRIIEIFMAIPRLFLLLTIIAFIPPEWNQYMLYAMMAVIGATSWMGAARFIRAEFFRLRDQDFIHAARACGLPLRSVLFKHMLPNGVTPVLVDASFRVAAAIFIETGLSFLGFGIKPPNPSWGKMLSDAVDPSTGVFYWWLAIFPGIMIFLTVFAFNLIGDALRDAIDPKMKKAAH